MKVNIKVDTLRSGTEWSGTFDAMHQPAADTPTRLISRRAVDEMAD